MGSVSCLKRRSCVLECPVKGKGLCRIETTLMIEEDFRGRKNLGLDSTVPTDEYILALISWLVLCPFLKFASGLTIFV